MIKRCEIEKAVKNFISGPELKLELLKYNKKDSLTVGELVKKLNYLKHRYFWASYSSDDDSEEIFERMCYIFPAFLLVNE